MAAEVLQTLEYRGGQFNVAPVLKLVKGSQKYKTPDERKAANLDQRLKSLIMFVLPDDQMNSNIPDDEEDTRSSQEYMNDLEEEYQSRTLLAKSKRFCKKGAQSVSVNKFPLKRRKSWELTNPLKIPPVFVPKYYQINFEVKYTIKEENHKRVVTLKEPSSAPAKDNKKVTSALKTYPAPAGKLKNVKIEDDPPLATMMKELNDLKLQLSKNKSSYSKNYQSQQEDLLPQAKFAYNRPPNKTTSLSPFIVVYGLNPKTLLDLAVLDTSSKFNQEASDRAVDIKALHHHIHYKITKYNEFFKILARVNDNAYKVSLPGTPKEAATLNAADIEPYYDPADPIPSLRAKFSEAEEDDRQAPKDRLI
ncbi:transposon ty3-I gag-pol polyprotein [Tanacetum coccineum]